MILRYLYHRDLAQASYLVGCSASGEALIVDPNRDIDQYIELAEREGLQIVAISETHIHADYVSGARELANKTGATLYLSGEGPEDWQYGFASESDATLVHDGDQITIGNIKVDVIYTPGHTPEHISFLVTDGANADQPMGIFTGDFVFVGDVGRPDLLEKAAGMAGTMDAGARNLFQSLQRFKELPDFVQVWPGHGAGSPCGKSLGAVPQSTVGYERLFNWAMSVEDEDEFVETVLADQPEPPVYFKQMKHVNKIGPTLRSDLPDVDELDSSLLAKKLNSGEFVVDVRSVDAFATGHVPDTINIPWGPGFVTWAGWLLPYDREFFIVTDREMIQDVVHELRMIGLDTAAGYWPESVIDDWAATGGELRQITILEPEVIEKRDDVQVVDVRGESEFKSGHIPDALHIPLGYLRENLDKLPDDKIAVFNCQSGRRSAIAASIAMAGGKSNVANLSGGYQGWVDSGANVDREKEPVASAD